jgi:hypothetical protein
VKHPITGTWKQVAAGTTQPETARGNSGQPATGNKRRALTLRCDFRVRRTGARHGWADDSEVKASANGSSKPEKFVAAPGGSEWARASTPRIELPREPTQRGWSIRRHRHGVEADGCHRLNQDPACAASGPHALRVSEPSAGSVIDLRSFTPVRASRLVVSQQHRCLHIAGATPYALVMARWLSAGTLIGVDPRRRP